MGEGVLSHQANAGIWAVEATRYLPYKASNMSSLFVFNSLRGGQLVICPLRKINK